MTKRITVNCGQEQPMVFTSDEANLDWFVDYSDCDDECDGSNRLVIKRGDEYVACFAYWSYVVGE